MIKNVAKSIIVVMIFSLCIVLSSCSENDGSNYLFRYALSQDPKNLDPQLATDTPSLVVIENMFEGLMDFTGTGALTEGVAFEYMVSEDGLTYTFKIKQNVFWNGANDYSENLTADDFVFAFKRLIDPETYSPYAKEFFCIKNAEKINSGEMNIENLGVSATGKYELTIQLEYPNANFLNLLATSPAMPCNEEFFYGTKGKYGLETNTIVSNGAFYLKEWLYDPYGKDNYLILRRNEKYNEIKRVYPSGLNFFIIRNEEERIKDFKSGGTDCFVDNGQNELLNLSENKKQKYEFASSGLVFNFNNSSFQTQEVRNALSISIDRGNIFTDISSDLNIAYGLIPSGVTMLNKSFRELASEPAIDQYNELLAQYLWKSSLTQSEKNSLNSCSIIVPESYNYAEYLTNVTDAWRDILQLYCVIEVLPDNEYKQRIVDGDYCIALVELTGEYNSPKSFLSVFETNSNKNIFNYSNIEYDNILKNSDSLKSLSDCVGEYSNAEKMLIDNYIYVPLFYQSEYLIYNEDIEGIEYNPFTKQVNFANAKKY